MTKRIETDGPTGSTFYAIRHNDSDQVWNVTLGAWEAFNASHWSNYAIALPEQGASGYYRGVVPAGSLDALGSEVIYQQAGGSPDITADSAYTIGQALGTDIYAVRGSLAAAIALALGAGSMVVGAAVTGNLGVTIMSTNLTNTLDKAYVGRTVIWTSGALTGVAAAITNYDGTLKILRFTAVPVAPANADTFIIV